MTRTNVLASRVKTLGWMLVLTFPAAACDPGYQLTGTVKSSTGAPIAGASVTAVCARPPLPSAVADATGTLNGRGVGFFADDCKLEVSAPGFGKQTFDVRSTCRARSMGSCLHVDITAVLTPEPKSP